MTRRIDLSHTLVHGRETYPGLPAPTIGAFLDRDESQSHYAAGTEFHIGRVEFVVNTGTYVDAPFHRFAEGADIARLGLDRLADVPGVCVRARDRAIGPSIFDGVDVRGKAVLVRTDFSRHWGTPRYFETHPHLTAAAADYLVAMGVRHVGIDSLNIDSRDDATRAVHTRLLGAQIPITEHLTNLASLPADGFRYFAVPVKVRGVGSFPVRAFALI